MEKMVYYFDLERFHVKVNPQLFQELIKIFDSNGTYAIPKYILIYNK